MGEEYGTEIGSSNYTKDGNGNEKLEVLTLVESLRSEGVTKIGYYYGI